MLLGSGRCELFTQSNRGRRTITHHVIWHVRLFMGGIFSGASLVQTLSKHERRAEIMCIHYFHVFYSTRLLLCTISFVQYMRSRQCFQFCLYLQDYVSLVNAQHYTIVQPPLYVHSYALNMSFFGVDRLRQRNENPQNSPEPNRHIAGRNFNVMTRGASMTRKICADRYILR